MEAIPTRVTDAQEQTTAWQLKQTALGNEKQQSTVQQADNSKVINLLFAPVNPENSAHHMTSTCGDSRSIKHTAPSESRPPQPNINSPSSPRDFSVLLTDGEGSIDSNPMQIFQGGSLYRHNNDVESASHQKICLLFFCVIVVYFFYINPSKSMQTIFIIGLHLTLAS